VKASICSNPLSSTPVSSETGDRPAVHSSELRGYLSGWEFCHGRPVPWAFSNERLRGNHHGPDV